MRESNWLPVICIHQMRHKFTLNLKRKTAAKAAVLALNLTKNQVLRDSRGKALLIAFDKYGAASDTELQVRDWTGTRIPMHAVPSGQVLLAEAPPEQVDAYVASPMARFTPGTIGNARQLRQRLDRVRQTGFAWAIDEFAEGLSSVAAAIRDADGIVVASLHVYGPTYRFPGDRDADELGRMVVEAAARVRVGTSEKQHS